MMFNASSTLPTLGHLVLHVSREPVGLAGMEANDHCCSSSIFVHASLLVPQSYFSRPVCSVDVHLASFAVRHLVPTQ